jgi:hypothetical protein
VRSMIFKPHDEWRNYATCASLVPGVEISDKLFPMRDRVALMEWSIPIANVPTSYELTTHLCHWRAVCKISTMVEFQEQITLARQSSDPRSEQWPYWSTQFYELNQKPNIGQLPEGPFFRPEERLFGQDVPKLAAQFLGEPRFSNQHSAPNEYTLRIPDHRARIADLSLEGNTLRVRVDNPLDLELYCGIYISAYAGQTFHDAVSLLDNQTTIELPFVLENIEVWIMLRDGYMLDHYQETPHGGMWGPAKSVLMASRKAQSHAITAALTSGETDSVEFKPYIQIKPRDNKAKEILRSVSAFANMAGGSLYIGINDAAEPEGIETQLNRDYGKQERDLATQQRAYEKDLKKLINEGTSPTLPIEYQWHDFAHLIILEVRIPQSQVPVHIPETGEVYRRAGGTNKKWRPVDVLTSTENKSPNPSGA